MFENAVKFKWTSKQENNFPVYIGSGDLFLFVLKLGYTLSWVIGPQIGDESTIIMKSTEACVKDSLPTSGWEYKDYQEWKTDSNLISALIPKEGS